MGDLNIDLMRYKQDHFDKISLDEEKITFGKLKALEDLSNYIDCLREAYTKLLVVNGARDCETDDDLKERWKNVKGLDNELRDDDKSVKSV